MEERKTQYTVAQWLDTAVARISFRPDQAAVRAELSAHLEDKTLDLRRIFPDLTQEEADQRAASEMGDPEEIGKELARLHKPWLGWLWRASQVLLALTLAALVCVAGRWGIDRADEAWNSSELEPYEAAVEIPFSGEEVQAGVYRLQAEGTLDLSGEEDQIGTLEVTWRASSPLIWEKPTSHLYWRGEDSLGNTYFSHAQLDLAIYVTESYRYVTNVTWERSGLGWKGRSQVRNVPREAQWVRLILDFGEQPITMLLEREEGTP